MSLPTILYSNLESVTFSASHGTASGGDVDNLKYGWSSDYWTSPTTSSNQYVLIDFGSTFPQKSRNFVLIDGHNLDSVMTGSGQVILQAATNSTFTSGQENVIVFNVTLDAASSREQIYYSPITPVAKRYWRMIYSGSVAEPPTLGKIFIDSRFEFQFPYKWNYKTENQRFESSVEKTAIDGTLLSSYTYDGRLIYELQFPKQNATFSSNFMTFHDTVRGKLGQFYFLDADGETIRKMKLDTDYSPIEVQRFGQNVLNSLVLKSVEVKENWYQENTIPDATELSGEDIGVV